MQDEAEALTAHGVVRVELSGHAHGWGAHVLDCFAVGTAIVRGNRRPDVTAPQPVLDLNDRSR
jgi:uncharacterized protein YbjQ (UPF0145 family)